MTMATARILVEGEWQHSHEQRMTVIQFFHPEHPDLQEETSYILFQNLLILERS